MVHRIYPLVTATAFTAVALLSGSAAAQFVPGDVYYAASSGEIVDVTAGGDLTGQVFADAESYTVGQLAWSLDLQTMYLTHYAEGRIVAIDTAGNVTDFATGLSGPSGLIMTREGVLLVAEFDSGEITDATAGGVMAGAAPLTDGLSGPRHLVQLADGTVLVADQLSSAVYDALYPNGGTIGLPFAEGLDAVRTLAVADDGAIYACIGELNVPGFVFDITAGGDFSSVGAYASGQEFFSITVSGDGKLLAGELVGSVLWDITGGGDFTGATPFATGLPDGESPLNTVPPAVCGTGTTEGDEECDDGNDSNEDDCLNDCTLPGCGDGFVWAGMEGCDDGNTDDGDGCSSTCEVEATGTGGMGGSASGGGGTGGNGGSGTGGAGGAGGGDAPGGNVGTQADEPSEGCGCATAPARDDGGWALLGLVGLAAARRRRRDGVC